VLDIRQRNEFAAGHLPGAVHLELGDLAAAERAAMATAGPDRRIPAGPLIVMCGHGERAMGAASLLHRAGRHDVSVLTEGPGDWAEATKTALDTGP
jgi:rhodanese-related sulfurtransferase